MDNGATWQLLGVALDEKWHLSFPYVFEHDGEVRDFVFSLFIIFLGV